MEIRQLKTFRAVATLGSFNKAADYLYYAQSTVSEQIKALETDLKIKLFKQIGKKILLTEAGEALLQYAQRMLNLEDEIRTEVGGYEETHGFLTVRVPETFSNYILPQIVNDFYQLYPKVGLKFNNCSYFSLEKDLLSGLINLAFLITNEFRAPDLETESLMEMPLVLLTNPGNPLASRQNVSIGDLKKYSMLLPTNDCSYVLMLEKVFTEEKVELSSLRFNSIETIKQTVIKGTGITVLPLMAVKNELDQGLLKALTWTNGPLQANLIMIWQKNKWLSPILKAFMDRTRKVFQV
jgi:DNA-binding transcriptional LysR family regulator